MEGLFFFIITHNMEWEASLRREHHCLIVVLVIEHLVHGVGTEHQEGNVNVLPDLEDMTMGKNAKMKEAPGGSKHSLCPRPDSSGGCSKVRNSV